MGLEKSTSVIGPVLRERVLELAAMYGRGLERDTALFGARMDVSHLTLAIESLGIELAGVIEREVRGAVVVRHRPEVRQAIGETARGYADGLVRDLRTGRAPGLTVVDYLESYAEDVAGVLATALRGPAERTGIRPTVRAV